MIRIAVLMTPEFCRVACIAKISCCTSQSESDASTVTQATSPSLVLHVAKGILCDVLPTHILPNENNPILAILIGSLLMPYVFQISLRLCMLCLFLLDLWFLYLGAVRNLYQEMGGILLLNLLFGLVILAPFVFFAQVGVAHLFFPKLGYPSLLIRANDDASLTQRELGFLVVFLLQVATVLFSLGHVL